MNSGDDSNQPDCRGPSAGLLAVSGGFAQEVVPRAEYYRLLTTSRIAPCPSGAWSPESFRLYESIMAGCLPVADRRSDKWEPDWPGYWEYVLGDEPFPCVDSWTELPALIDSYRNEPIRLQRDANKAGSWLLSYQRKFAYDLFNDCEELGAPVNRPLCTILMPSSPTLAHPSTADLESTIAKLRAYPELENAEIFIMLDGVRPEQEHREADYEEYRRRVIELCAWDKRFRGCLPIVYEKWMHQSGMQGRALGLVRTPLVMYCESDTFPKGDIDFAGIFRATAREDVDLIRLSIFHDVIPEHASMYAKHTINLGVPLLATSQFSARPFIAKTTWWRALMDDYFTPEERCFVEDKIHGMANLGAGAPPWRMHCYWPEGPDKTRSGTSDARGEESKYPCFMGGKWVG